jgi:DNA topoisomerase III
VSKKLIIAEKPSVAADIARVLGGFTRHDDYFESDAFVLSSAIGHLVEIAAPEEYEVKRGKWSFTHLPVIPPHFDLRPIEKTESRLKLLARLIKRKEVDGLINACDAGREGELIFHYIAHHSGNKKPVQRLWLQSMTKQAIQTGFDTLRAGTEMQGLCDAAMCRSESDWLVGINGTRAMTAFNSKSGGFHLTTVGRVQTPTLAIMVEREEKIRRFKSRDYWEIEAEFACAAGAYTGRWFNEKFKKGDDEDATATRLWDATHATAIHDRCLHQTGIASEKTKPSTSLPPLLFDLTSLQREANGRFGFSAKTTLGIAQALYEKHKVLTYPRTDARALPEDYIGQINGIAAGLPVEYAPFAQQIIKNGWARPNKRIFDNSKISDHFAIIPTGTAPKALSEVEQKLYDFVTKRFLAVFFPAAESLVTTRITRVGADAFKTEGKVLVTPGWLAVYGKSSEGDDDKAPLVAVTPDEPVKNTAVEVKAQRTKPPARYNEGTLLSAMEGAGKMVDDEELRAAMEGRGLGTPATRAATIEGLITERYIYREGRDLVPTTKAFQLLTALRGLKIDALCSAELTGDWEFKLKQMERGQLARTAFMHEIATLTERMVDQIKAHQDDDILGDFATLATPCPKCAGVIKENYKKYACQSCDWSTWKIVAGRLFEVDEIETLLTHGRVGPLMGFRSKKGFPFDAEIILNEDKQPTFDFGDPPEGEGDDPVDFSGVEALGACPKCAAKIYPLGNNYVCERSVGPDKTCDFRSGQLILQQPIEPAQMQKLLATGKTDLLTHFVSARTRRPFSAFLAWDAAQGKVIFEFAPSEGKRGAATAAPGKELGKHPADAKPVSLHAGRYGPYVQHGKINASLPKDHPPESFSLEEAIALLEAKGGKVVVKATPKAKAKATPKATPKPRVRAKKTA